MRLEGESLACEDAISRFPDIVDCVDGSCRTCVVTDEYCTSDLLAVIPLHLIPTHLADVGAHGGQHAAIASTPRHQVHEPVCL